MPTARRRAGLTGNGNDGWLRTGANIASSTIIPSANPPVKHMPTAPTPGPPHCACASAARPRSQPITGLVRPSAKAVNSRETHTRARVPTVYPTVTSRPGVPNSDGMRTLNPAPTTRRAKSRTCGCSPGTSWMTMTAGPVPAAYTGCVTPSCVKVDSEKPGSDGVTMWNTTGFPTRGRGVTMADDTTDTTGDIEEIEEVEVVATAVGDDGSVVVDDLKALVDEDGNVLATDETIAVESPDGTVLVDEVIAVAGEDGELVAIEEDVAVIEEDGEQN